MLSIKIYQQNDKSDLLYLFGHACLAFQISFRYVANYHDEFILTLLASKMLK